MYNFFAHGEAKVSEGGSVTEGIGLARVTRIIEDVKVDNAYLIPDEEAVPIIFDLLRHEGLCLGGSTGINVAGAIRLAKRARPRPHHRHHPRRHWRSLSVEAVQPGLPALEGPAGAGMAGATSRTSRCRMSEQVPSPASHALVTTEWLAEKLGAPDLVVVDGSFYLPAMKRDAAAEYLAGHIPGAVRFDIDAIADHAQDPCRTCCHRAKHFARMIGALGIADTDTIVVYDGVGLFAAPRVWWTFRLFGAQNVFILEGGLPKWKAEGRPLESGEVKRTPRTFNARKPPDMVASLRDVQAAFAGNTAQVVDARPADRFRGEAPEPRPGVRSGHIPARSTCPPPSWSMNGRLLPPEQLKLGVCRRWRRSRSSR